MEPQTDQPRERIFISFHNDINNDSNHEPLQVAYPDPPPAYEEYYRKTNDTDLCGNATNQLPIQEQPRTIRIVSISKGSGACGGMPELLLTSSIVLSVICLFVFPCVLACTVPAVALSIAAKDALRRGQIRRGKCHIWTGIILDLVAILSAIIFVTVLIVLEVSRESL